MFERILVLFDAKNETPPNQTKSIHMCNPNMINTPENAQINIASEINLNPIVSHQIIKNGFNPLSKIPVINEPCFEFLTETCFSLPAAALPGSW